MHPCAVDVAVKAEPGMRVAVGALPVRDAFAQADRAAGREGSASGPAGLSCWCVPGRWAWGRVGRAVTAVLAAGPEVQAVVVCGRNEGLREELAGPRRAAGPAERARLDR